MSAPIKTKEQLTRLAWTTELRRQGHRQCEGTYFMGNRVCALGLLMEIAVPAADHANPFWDTCYHVGGLAGLGVHRSHRITVMNDGSEGTHKHTFAEIADVIDGWFAP